MASKQNEAHSYDVYIYVTCLHQISDCISKEKAIQYTTVGCVVDALFLMLPVTV